MDIIRKLEAAPSQTRDATQQQQIEEAYTSLEPGALYIMLFYHTGLDNEFHWTLYHHIDPKAGGWKYHIIRENASFPWETDNRVTHSLDDNGTEPLVGLIRVGNLGQDEAAQRVTGAIVQAEDARINNWEGLMCRVYVKSACERLRKSGHLKFESWKDLEDEVHVFANPLNADFEREDDGAPLPRPVVASVIAT